MESVKLALLTGVTYAMINGLARVRRYSRGRAAYPTAVRRALT